MDVGEWLKGVGLSQYEPTIRAHDIDVGVLPLLTEAGGFELSQDIVQKVLKEGPLLAG